MSRAGRLQQLEAAAIGLWLKMGMELEAAQVAMRIFAEDEFILESTFVRAGDALLMLMLESDAEGQPTFTKKTIAGVRDDLRRMLKTCKNVTMDIGKCLLFTIELSNRWEGHALQEKINAACLNLYDRHCHNCDYMGVVAFSTKENLMLDLCPKNEYAGRQRTLLDIATLSTTDNANHVLPLAVQMVVDAEASHNNDSHVIVIMDGKVWGTSALPTVQAQLRRLSRERNSSLNLFILGVGIDRDEIKEECKELCAVSKTSFYVDLTLENVDSVFESIAAAIAGRHMTYGYMKGITMERF
jgi:hypothetical protein